MTLHPDGVVVHAAAVGDYESAPEAGKIPSGQAELVLTLRPAPKILDQIVRWSSSVSVVSFKAAPPGTDHQALAKICASQLQRTQSIAVFGNTIGQLSTHSMLVTAKGPQRFTSRADALGALGALVTAIRARATSEAE